MKTSLEQSHSSFKKYFVTGAHGIMHSPILSLGVQKIIQEHTVDKQKLKDYLNSRIIKCKRNLVDKHAALASPNNNTLQREHLQTTIDKNEGMVKAFKQVGLELGL